METRELTGGEAIVQGLIDAFAKNGDRIRTIGARREQTCGYMAFGYARASGRPGVFAYCSDARLRGLCRGSTGAHRGESATRRGWRPLEVHSSHFQLNTP
jgi:hypothetical protein